MDLGLIALAQQAQDRIDEANLRRDRARERASYADARADRSAAASRRLLGDGILAQREADDLAAENAQLRAEVRQAKAEAAEYAGHVARLLTALNAERAHRT